MILKSSGRRSSNCRHWQIPPRRRERNNSRPRHNQWLPQQGKETILRKIKASASGLSFCALSDSPSGRDRSSATRRVSRRLQDEQYYLSLGRCSSSTFIKGNYSGPGPHAVEIQRSADSACPQRSCPADRHPRAQSLRPPASENAKSWSSGPTCTLGRMFALSRMLRNINLLQVIKNVGQQRGNDTEASPEATHQQSTEILNAFAAAC
jgi:hypothetical protein